MKHGFLFLVFFVPLSMLDAQLLLAHTRFIPPVFHVGDMVELQLEYNLDSFTGIEIPKTLPEAEWIDIKDINIGQIGDGISIRIRFTSFAAGTRTLPSIDLGAIVLQDIKIPTISMMEDFHDGARRLRKQMLLPGTRLGLAIILALIAMSPFLIHAFYKLLLKFIVSIRSLLLTYWPVFRFRRLLKRLRGYIDLAPAADWCSELTNGLRAYLSIRMDCDCRSSTTSEISTIMESSVDDGIRDRVLEVLKNGDMVKFAGLHADAAGLRQILDATESAVSQWEKNLARVQ